MLWRVFGELLHVKICQTLSLPATDSHVGNMHCRCRLKYQLLFLIFLWQMEPHKAHHVHISDDLYGISCKMVYCLDNYYSVIFNENFRFENFLLLLTAYWRFCHSPYNHRPPLSLSMVLTITIKGQWHDFWNQVVLKSAPFWEPDVRWLWLFFYNSAQVD